MNKTAALLAALSSRVIAYNVVYAQIMGDSASGGVILSQLVHWAKSKDFGEFYKSDRELRKETCTSDWACRSARKKLEDMGIFQITREGIPATNHYVINVDALIDAIAKAVEKPTNLSVETNEQVDTKPTNCSVETNELSITKNNKDDTYIYSAQGQKYSLEDKALAELLIHMILENNPEWQMRGSIHEWSNNIRKLREIDKRTPRQIEYMIRWVQTDDFWSSNILSTAKLRAQFNNLIPKVRKANRHITNQAQVVQL